MGWRLLSLWLYLQHDGWYELQGIRSGSIQLLFAVISDKVNAEVRGMNSVFWNVVCGRNTLSISESFYCHRIRTGSLISASCWRVWYQLVQYRILGKNLSGITLDTNWKLYNDILTYAELTTVPCSIYEINFKRNTNIPDQFWLTWWWYIPGNWRCMAFLKSPLKVEVSKVSHLKHVV